MTETLRDVCVTCADELRSVVVEQIVDPGRVAMVSDAGEVREVSIELVDEVSAGDVLLMHGGVALQHGMPSAEPVVVP
ncbi:MAG TPA: HypC/HybG/HupF family hydrogenase formation chaperone [Candidatus Dormibacteraeota bacterium]